MSELLSKELLHILQHSLGVDQYGQGEMYRNRFCAGGKDIEKCQELTRIGYMVERKPVFNDPRWSVTEEGIQAVQEQSPKPPQVNKSFEDWKYKVIELAKYNLGSDDPTWLVGDDDVLREQFDKTEDAEEYVQACFDALDFN